MRLIARLDIKNGFVIKGIHLEGLRKIGDPNDLARDYYGQGIDEIVFMDAVASLYDRNNIFPIIEAASRQVFVPIAVGGGLRSLEDIEQCLKVGADKVVINTAAVQRPEFIAEASYKYGRQSIVGSIEAKKKGGTWEAYIANGRDRTGLDAIEWAKRLEELGIGELLITSVDRDGTRKGFDVDLVAALNKAVSVPVIASGGFGQLEHLKPLQSMAGMSAVAIGASLHYKQYKVSDIKGQLLANPSQGGLCHG